MKVLFVCSGNSRDGMSSIVKNQARSLEKVGCDIDFFTINKRGIWGYLYSVPVLHKRIKIAKPDIIHAHYLFSAIVASLAFARPLIVSLMGSDVSKSYWLRHLIRLFSRYFWHSIIVKSSKMKEILSFEDLIVIPNGVDIDIFRPMPKDIARDKLGWENDKRHLLFAANPAREVKNFPLAKKAVDNLHCDVELHCLNNVSTAMIPYYYSASDVVLLTSRREGSPNVIKEAMACNVPIVSTDVGDVKWVFGDTEGCFLSSFDHKEYSINLISALKFAGKRGHTIGRQRVIALQLDSTHTAQKLMKIYKDAVVQ